MKIPVAAVTLLVLVALPLFAAEDAGSKDRTRQALLYGIDSQVLDAIASIKAAQDQDFTKELVQILSEQRSEDVQMAVFDLFKEQKIRDGEEYAKKALAGWQDLKSGLVISAVQYLSAISSAGLAAALTPLVDASENALASAAIQALGSSGDSSAATLLVAKLKNPDFQDARKNDVILALGNLKDPSAVDELLAIARSQDEDKVRRMYAADSLGKIGDSRALPVLRGMFAENDALIRLYAASALSRFGLDEVFPSLVQGLRDENVKVREQSANALARALNASQAQTALPILSYKAKLDPEPSVRLASIQALGAIGGDEAMKVLLTLYGSSDYPLASREAALGILAVQALPASLETIRSVISTEWTSFDARVLESTAKVLSTIKSTELKDLYVRFLESKDAVVRSYGVRGIAVNGFSDLKQKVKQIADQDPNPGTRTEAAASYAKL